MLASEFRERDEVVIDVRRVEPKLILTELFEMIFEKELDELLLSVADDKKIIELCYTL